MQQLSVLYAGGGMGSLLSSSRNTAWGLVNAVTEYVDHRRRARSQDYRLDAELVQYAPLVARLEVELWAVQADGFPGRWHYDVVENLGWAITDWIVTHDGMPPGRAWVTATLVVLAGQFFQRAPQTTWPALRAVLQRYVPALPADLLNS